MEETDRTISLNTLILIPVFNDWKSLDLLLDRLEETLVVENSRATILIVDDGSTVPIYEGFGLQPFQAICQINVLALKRNVGHQRAIAIGLAYIEANLPCHAVVVMDSDGEDAASDVPRLIQKCAEENDQKVVFARRTQRSESWMFRIFYVFYKLLYRILTGQDIRFGNFSIVPCSMLKRLVAVSEIWSHYAAGVQKSRVPCTEISSRRGMRLYGRSQMNFVSLVTHGLSAISVYSDIVGVRLLIASSLLILATVAAILMVVTIRLTTSLAIPGWTSYMAVLLFIMLTQVAMLSLGFVFIVLAGRNSYNVLPQRDHPYFILNYYQLSPIHD